MARREEVLELAPHGTACRSCAHAVHLGPCTARLGGTAYACACTALTEARDARCLHCRRPLRRPYACSCQAAER